MPRSQTYDPSFSHDLGDGRHFMNPRTSEIFDTSSNTVYASPDELGMSIQSQQSQMQPGGSPSQGGGAGTAGGIGGLASTGSGLYSMFGGGASAGATGTGAVAGTGAGSAAVGSSIGGGTMLANGTVAPMTAGYAGVPAGTGLAGMGAYALPAAGVIAGVAGGQDSIRRLTDGQKTPTDWRQGAASIPNAPVVGVYNAIGKPLGIKRDDAMRATMMLNPMTAPLALLDMAGVPVFGNDSRKHREKLARKAGRTANQDVGIMNTDSRSRYNQFDGNQFDIGEYKTRTGNDAYNIDFNDSVDDNDVGFLNALGYAMHGGKSNKDGSQNKLISDLTGERYNAGKNSGDIKANNRFYGDKLGGAGAIKEGLAQRWRDGQITAQQRDAGFAATDKEYGIINTNNARWEDGAALSEKDNKRNTEELSMIPKAPKAPSAPSVPGTTTAPMATTKPLPVGTMAGNRNGGRPAATFRPGATVNPHFKNQPYKIPKKK